MDINKLTIKSQEVLQQAQFLAKSFGQQTVETGHLLKAMLEVDEHVVPYLMKKMNVNLNTLTTKLNSLTESYPKVSGGQIYLSSEVNELFQKAF